MRLWLFAGCAFALAACAPQATTPTPEQQVERGRYLVTAVVLCNDCHTPHSATGEADMTRSLQGSPLPFAPIAPMPFAAVAPSIAGLPAGYTDAQFHHFLMTGERPDGTHPNPPMPPYRLNEEDARDVAAFIKTLPRAAQ